MTEELKEKFVKNNKLTILEEPLNCPIVSCTTKMTMQTYMKHLDPLMVKDTEMVDYNETGRMYSNGLWVKNNYKD